MMDMDSENTTNQIVLPKEGFIRLEVALTVFSCKKTKFLEGVRDGTIPKPYKWGRCSLWDVNEIREAIVRLKTNQ